MKKDLLIPACTPSSIILPFNTRNVVKPFPQLKRTVKVYTPFARNVGDGGSHRALKSTS